MLVSLLGVFVVDADGGGIEFIIVLNGIELVNKCCWAPIVGFVASAELLIVALVCIEPTMIVLLDESSSGAPLCISFFLLIKVIFIILKKDLAKQ